MYVTLLFFFQKKGSSFSFSFFIFFLPPHSSSLCRSGSAPPSPSIPPCQLLPTPNHVRHRPFLRPSRRPSAPFLCFSRQPLPPFLSQSVHSPSLVLPPPSRREPATTDHAPSHPAPSATGATCALGTGTPWPVARPPDARRQTPRTCAQRVKDGFGGAVLELGSGDAVLELGSNENE